MSRYRAYCRCNRIACATCVVTPSGPGLKSHRAFLSPRMPEAEWLREASMYQWPLWRNRKLPKPLKVETAADVTRRLLSYKPAGYSWRIERLTPAQRIALGCLPKPAVRATRKRVREAA